VHFSTHHIYGIVQDKTKQILLTIQHVSRVSENKLQLSVFGLYVINTKNYSLSIVLTATDQKPQKSLKNDIIHHHIA